MNKIGSIREQLSHGNEERPGSKPLLQWGFQGGFTLHWLSPYPAPLNVHAEVQAPCLDAAFREPRGAGGDLDHGFNHQPSAWLCLHWWQGPGEGTSAGAQHCPCKERLFCPQLRVPSLMGTSP